LEESKMGLIVDIETDNLLSKVTRMYVLVTCDTKTKEIKHYLEGDLSWKTALDSTDSIIGHNIISFDLCALEKLFNYRPKSTTKIYDTLIFSQVLDYRRFKDEGHSLKAWGSFLKFPKGEFDDFSKFSEEMLDYCIQDVKLTLRVYEYLMSEFRTKGLPKLSDYLKAEHFVAKWCADANLKGWPFDIKAAQELSLKLEAEMNKAYSALTSKLGMKTVAVDKKLGIVESKRPKWTKQGFYDAHTSRWFNVDPCSGFEGEERMIEGEYSRVEFVNLSLDSVQDVKIFLFRNNWQPTDWNYKTIIDERGRSVRNKTSPKITEDSLEFLGGDGKLYTEFLTAKSRHSILKTWIENTDENGYLHGDCMTIGTPSMRARHSIIVNVPSADSPWGPEMRKLFVAEAGHVLIGADSASNQARGLAHFLNDETFIDTLIKGDIHQYNADLLTKVLKESLKMDYEVKRAAAKRILYAFLFGASGSKLWSYIFGSVDETKGKKLKNGFVKAVPGFEKLNEKLSGTFVNNESEDNQSFISSVVGNKIYVDSFHKLLVYLLQSTEKITCAGAIMTCATNLEKEKIPYKPKIFMHDEIQFSVPVEFKERAAEIAKEAFKEGPKIFGIQIMDGSAKIGANWYDTH